MHILLYLLLFPITGIITLIKEFRGKDFGDFMDEWGIYLLFLLLWCTAIGLIALFIYHLIVNTAITCTIICIVIAIAFVIVGIPYLIYKNVKWKK